MESNNLEETQSSAPMTDERRKECRKEMRRVLKSAVTRNSVITAILNMNEEKDEVQEHSLEATSDRIKHMKTSVTSATQNSSAVDGACGGDASTSANSINNRMGRSSSLSDEAMPGDLVDPNSSLNYSRSQRNASRIKPSSSCANNNNQNSSASSCQRSTTKNIEGAMGSLKVSDSME